MRLHRFYVKEDLVNKTEVAIHSAELVNQVLRVFRLKAGDAVVLFNGTGKDYECKIDDTHSRRIMEDDNVLRLAVTGSKPSRFMPARRLFLCAAIVKKDTFEWIVEKATELGATDIISIAADRSEKKSLNEERLVKIATEASEQSGRGVTPMVQPIMGLEDAAAFVKRESPSAKLLAFHTEGEAYDRGEIADAKQPLAVFIGPEGGWSPEEIAMFHSQNIPVRSLGSQVLRAETAVVTTLSLAVFG